MTDRVKDLLDWFRNHYDEIRICGVFSTRNVVDDHMDNIYSKDDVVVDTCYGWDYIEVFGLSEEEFNDFRKVYDKLSEDKKNHLLYLYDDDNSVKS